MPLSFYLSLINLKSFHSLGATSKMSLSATLPSNRLFLLVQKTNMKSQEEPLVLPSDENTLSTPTSESSSNSIPLKYNNKDDTLSQTDEARSGHTIFSKRDSDSANSFSKEKRAFDFNVESLSAAATALFKPSHFNPQRSCSIQVKYQNKFNDEFYNRIEEFLDNEGLDIATPEDKIAQQSKSTVKRLLAVRALSEDTGNGQISKIFSEGTDNEPLSLRESITTSSLFQRRRASLNNASPKASERQSLAQTKLYFNKLLRETEEIYEENEASEYSKRSSPCITSKKNLSKLNTHFRENSFDMLSDLQSSLSRKDSQATPNIFPSNEYPQSLSKLSPVMKGTKFNLEPTTYFSPQLDLKKTTKNLPKVSPLSIYVRKPQTRDSKNCKNIRNNMEGISSFGEILSISSDSSPDLFRVDFN